MTKKHNTPVIDERQKQIQGRAWNFAGGFLALCVLASLIYDIVTTGNAGWELFALIGSCLVFLLSSRKLGDIQPPKDWKGQPLPTGNASEERRKRKKNYAIESLIFAVTCAMMDVLLICFGMEMVTDYELTSQLFHGLSKPALTVLTALIVLFLSFGISYTVEYLYGERVKVRKYNEMIASLDCDEE